MSQKIRVYFVEDAQIKTVDEAVMPEEELADFEEEVYEQEPYGYITGIELAK